jgi:tripartite-type tricarboxylate transporter receptor subunit TctC
VSAESGLTGFEAPGSWTGICAPSGIPKEVVQKIHTIAATMAVPEVRNKFLELGYEIFPICRPINSRR